MRRYIQPEILDELAVDDPRAIQSRRDLRKINAFMGTHGHADARPAPVSDTLAHSCRARCGRRHVSAESRQRLGRQTGMRAMLVDRRPSVSVATRDGFKAAGWDDRHLRV